MLNFLKHSYLRNSLENKIFYINIFSWLIFNYILSFLTFIIKYVFQIVTQFIYIYIKELSSF